jgi:hypothetical protein
MGEKWQYFIEEGYLLPVIFVRSSFNPHSHLSSRFRR